MDRTLFVINPSSGSGRALRTWARVRPELARRRHEFSEYFTTGAGDAARATRQALETGVRQVVAVGGDGTLNEVVNGYLRPDGQPVNPEARLAILAAGTGSDFRKSIYPIPRGGSAVDPQPKKSSQKPGDRNEKMLPEKEEVAGLPGSAPFREGLGDADVPDGIERAIVAITGCESRLVDAGLINCRDRSGAPVSRFFINVVSFGLGGDVSRLVNSWRGWLPTWIGGRARFAAAAVGALAHYKTRVVLVGTDKSEVRVDSNLLVIANGRFAGGGMMLAPQACLDDGLFDVVITDRASRLDVIRELPRIRRGGYIENPKVRVLRAAEVRLVTEELVPLDIDGESGDYAPAQLRVLRSVIRFAVEPGNREFRRMADDGLKNSGVSPLQR